MVFDPEPHAGVLPALATGLQTARGRVCLVAACDMPFISTAVFEYLLDQLHDADLVIPRTAGFLEPMHAVYRTAPVLAAIQAALARGERRMVSYFGQVRVREVTPDELTARDPAGLAFFNVNTPEDLAEARRRATEI